MSPIGDISADLALNWRHIGLGTRLGACAGTFCVCIAPTQRSQRFFEARPSYDGFSRERVNLGYNFKVHTLYPLKVYSTHTPYPHTHAHTQKPAYGSAILVVRNPFHALVAEWSRLAGKSHDHTSQLSRDYFGEITNPVFNFRGNKVMPLIERWPLFELLFCTKRNT